MTSISTARGLAIAALLLLPAAAAAQPSDTSLDQRVQAVARPPDAATLAEEAILTGRDDIVLMRARRFFTLEASVAGFHTTNAALTADSHQDDFATVETTLRFATRLADRVDVYAEAGLATAQYRRFEDLGYVAFDGAVGAHVRVSGFDVDAAYAPIVIWDHKAQQHQLTQHRFLVTLSRGWTLPIGASLRLAAGAERIEASPSPYTNTGVTLSASLAAPLNHDNNLFLFLAVRGVGRNYDNYFQDFVGAPRHDRLLEGSVGIGWSPVPRLNIDLRWSQSRNWSTSDVNRYRAGVGGLALRTALRF